MKVSSETTTCSNGGLHGRCGYLASERADLHEKQWNHGDSTSLPVKGLDPLGDVTTSTSRSRRRRRRE